jgi:quercetin dioxygenase-like cupin family protein
MSNASKEHRQRHPLSLVAPYLEFDIERELEQLHREAGWQTGQNAKTLVKFDGLRIVLIALKARSRIAGHHTDGPISIQTVAGNIRVRAQGQSFDLPTGGLLALNHGTPHDVEALDESAFLLTIAWPGEKDRAVS